VVALRFATGETFERLVRPAEGLPSDAQLAQLGLCARDFESALAPAELGAALDAFARPGDVGLAWNGSTPSLMHDATGRPHRMRLLKPVLRGLGPLDEHGSLQSLDALADLARAELGAAGDARGAGAPALQGVHGLHGRAAQRLANLACVAHATRLRARKAPADERSSDKPPGRV
jgi:hypothetical protein